MIDPRKTIARHAASLLIPLWAGILTLPFTGAARALQIAVVAAIGMALFRVMKSNALAGPVGVVVDRVRVFGNWVARLSGRVPIPAAVALSVLFLIVVPLFQNDYYRDVLTLTAMYIVLALGLSLVVGQAGLLNLGYVAFYAVGAYTYAILSTRFGLPFWPGLAAGAAAAAASALFIGLVTLKLRGDYFAIVTLGFGEITRIVLNNWDSLTGGPNGIAQIARPSLAGHIFRSPLEFYYLVLLLVIITVIAMRRLVASRIGRAWIAIRDDEVAAEAMGVNTFRLKLLAFVLASALAGIVGVFFAAKMAFVSPESFTFFESVLVLCMVVLGGMGSIPGIMLGAFLLITLPEIFRDFQDYRMIGFGVALVLMMIFRPQGLLGAGKWAGAKSQGQAR